MNDMPELTEQEWLEQNEARDQYEWERMVEEVFNAARAGLLTQWK